MKALKFAECPFEAAVIVARVMAKVSKKRKRFSVCHKRGLHTVFERSNSVEVRLNGFETSRVSKPLYPSGMGRHFTHRRRRQSDSLLGGG